MRGASGGPLRAGAFTLLEMIVVIALIGVVASLTLVSVFSAREEAARRETLTRVHALLLTQRVSAMEHGEVASLTLELPEEAGADGGWSFIATLKGPGDREEVRRLSASGLGFADRFGPLVRTTATFDPMGRTSEREWRFPLEDGGEGKVWRIVFDPVAGTPLLARPGVARAASAWGSGGEGVRP